jgi:hypothetical protein
MKRRKRSHMSREDCLVAFEKFALRVQRQSESSGGTVLGGEAPFGQLDVTFRVLGQFGVAEEMFEAVRVLAGHKLPRVASTRNTQR